MQGPCGTAAGVAVSHSQLLCRREDRGLTGRDEQRAGKEARLAQGPMKSLILGQRTVPGAVQTTVIVHCPLRTSFHQPQPLVTQGFCPLPRLLETAPAA